MKNEEIKEILSLLNSSSWSNEAKQIEDYITNLNNQLKWNYQEINRLRNIINELEKELKQNLKFRVIGVKRLLVKLKELQGSDNNE